MTPGGDPCEHTAPPAGTEGPSARWPPRARGRPVPGVGQPLRTDTTRVSALSGSGARCAASPSPRPPSPGSPPPAPLPQPALPQGRGPYLQLGEEDLPPVGVGRHGAPLWTPHLKAASGAAEGGEGGTGAGRGVRTGEKAAARESWRRGPTAGAAQAARLMESGGERGPSARLPLAARRRPPDSVPSAAPSGRRREPPRSSRCGAQRPRRQLPLSHHLAVTASQKPPRLAAAGARDGRGPAPGWAG